MLSDVSIRSAKPKEKPYKLTDGHGLYIEIRPTGSKLWRFRYRIAGKENVFALGAFPAKPVPAAESDADRDVRLKLGILTLAEARTEHLKARALVKQGIHPARHRKSLVLQHIRTNGRTLRAVAEDWMADAGKDWSPKYRYNVEHCFARDVFPHIGALPVAAIKPAHVLHLIDRIRNRSPSMAKATKMWLGGLFRFAVVRLLVEEDPTSPLKGLVKAPKVQHHRPLQMKRLGAFLRHLDNDGAWPPTRAACKLLWLTLVRTNELLNARWEEFDLDEALWRIPGARMKMREDHVVPLSQQAVATLEAVKPLAGTQGHVFASHLDRRRALGYAAIRNAFARVGKVADIEHKFTPHGVRATFSTLANDAGIRADVIERSLAHQERNATRRAYNRSILLAERQELMQRWADMLEQLREGSANPLSPSQLQSGDKPTYDEKRPPEGGRLNFRSTGVD